MSSAVWVAGLVHAVQVGGFVREADEGIAAHLFQLLIPAQIPIIALFAATQLPRDPGWTLRILALQMAAALSLFAVVFLNHL